MRITIAQLNPWIGDITGNTAKALSALEHAADQSSDLIIFPELFLVGYPPRDLLERPWFIGQVQDAVNGLVEISARFPDTGLLIGAPQPTDSATGKSLYNSALLIYQGHIVFKRHKSLLPTYDVFDEARYFTPSLELETYHFKDEILGITICEDAWNIPELWPERRIYAFDPVAELVKKGATLLINISASPFRMGKDEIRFKMASSHAMRHKVPFVFVNQVGGNDDLVFDGRSMLITANGRMAASCPPFKEDIVTIDTHASKDTSPFQPLDKINSVHDALILGLRDYAKKCGFSRVLVGLSGGIDSAVTCCLAVEALGAENVLGVSMPSLFSSTGSVEDAKKLSRNLGIELQIIPINSIYDAYLETLRLHSEDGGVGVVEENLQARIRGNLLMALSNKYGYLVLPTGNKSELAVGYCTLYGDMSGGLSVISDVPKTMVYEIAEFINKKTSAIPHEILTKAPSAELKPEQLDQDTLPPYPVLDQILNLYIEESNSAEEIIAQGFEVDMVKWVVKAVDANEYKRKQAPPGLKVTTKAFGVGRRMPIAAKHETD